MIIVYWGSSCFANMNVPLDEKDLRIRAELDLSQVHWKLAASILVSHFDLMQSAAEVLVAGFRRRCEGPLQLTWFKTKALSKADSQVFAALCEAHGADALSISVTHCFAPGGVTFGYRHQVFFQLAPGSRAAGGVVLAQPGLELIVGKWNVVLRSLRSVLILQLLLVMLAILFYVVAAGCFLYGVAVLLLFLADPAYVTVAATKRLPVGLALVCMLAGLAGICGRAVRNIIRLFWQGVSSRRRSH